MWNLLLAISAAALYFVTTSDCSPKRCTLHQPDQYQGTARHGANGQIQAGACTPLRQACRSSHCAAHQKAILRIDSASLTLLRSISSCSDPESDMMGTQGVTPNVAAVLAAVCLDSGSEAVLITID